MVRRRDPNQERTRRGGTAETRRVSVSCEVARVRAELTHVRKQLQAETARSDHMRSHRDHLTEQLERERRRNTLRDRPPERGFDRNRHPEDYNWDLNVEMLSEVLHRDERRRRYPQCTPLFAPERSCEARYWSGCSGSWEEDDKCNNRRSDWEK